MTQFRIKLTGEILFRTRYAKISTFQLAQGHLSPFEDVTLKKNALVSISFSLISFSQEL